MKEKNKTPPTSADLEPWLEPTWVYLKQNDLIPVWMDFAGFLKEWEDFVRRMNLGSI